MADPDRVRAWIFTINNYTEEDLACVEQTSQEKNVKYLVCGKEVAPTTGTPHIQGYVRWANGVSRATACRRLGGRASVRVACRGGLDAANKSYCSKDTQWLEVGEPSEPGKRTDLAGLRDEFAKHGSIGKCVREIAGISYQGIRGLEVMSKYTEPQRNWVTEVYWYYGSTGTGKTRRAFAEAEDPWVSSGNLKWWDGYDGHEDVILDDFRAEDIRWSVLLRILDRYPFRVEVKGGFRQLLARRIWITSDTAPGSGFVGVGDKNQLLRRLTKVVNFDCTEVQGNNGAWTPDVDSENSVDDGKP